MSQQISSTVVSSPSKRKALIIAAALASVVLGLSLMGSAGSAQAAAKTPIYAAAHQQITLDLGSAPQSYASTPTCNVSTSNFGFNNLKPGKVSAAKQFGIHNTTKRTIAGSFGTPTDPLTVNGTGNAEFNYFEVHVWGNGTDSGWIPVLQLNNYSKSLGKIKAGQYAWYKVEARQDADAASDPVSNSGVCISAHPTITLK